MDAIECLKSRRSVRAFQQRAISRDVLTDLVDCARLAPTAMNQQLWEFVVVTDRPMVQKLGQLIGHAKFLPDAPACIAVLCKDNAFYVEDGSAATMNILYGAAAHGLGACWIAGDKQPYADAVRQQLAAPSEYRFFSAIALGYPAEAPVKDKRLLESVLHWERF